MSPTVPASSRSEPCRLLDPPSAFLAALPASRPLERPGTAWGMYADLIGDWEAEVIDRLPDGSERRQGAEILFAWVLEGRATGVFTS